MTLYAKSLKFDTVSLPGIFLCLIPLCPYGVVELYEASTLLRGSVSTSKKSIPLHYKVEGVTSVWKNKFLYIVIIKCTI
jgi:hypothetical protein